MHSVFTGKTKHQLVGQDADYIYPLQKRDPALEISA
jgi:hypothetical protein